MRVLIAYASYRGSTAEIARRISEILQHEGLIADLRAMSQTENTAGYDAVVLGSAIHQQAWLPEAASFVQGHAGDLIATPVWLFSVGMSDALPSLIRQAARRGQDRRLAGALRDMTRPRGHALFSGVARAEDFPWWVRVMFKGGGARFGDLRDWAEIESWARGIAQDLRAVSDRLPEQA